MRGLLSALAIFCCAGLVLSARDESKTDISGKWHFVVDTEDGGRSFDLVFKQDGEKITFQTKDGSQHNGTFSDGKLSLEFPTEDEQAGSGLVKMKGAMVDGAFNGTWEFQDYSGTFKATKGDAPPQDTQPAKPDPQA